MPRCHCQCLRALAGCSSPVTNYPTLDTTFDFRELYTTSPALFGADSTPGLVGCFLEDDGQVTTWWRRGHETEERGDSFSPFLWLSDPSLTEGFEGQYTLEKLAGDQAYCHLVRFEDYATCDSFRQHVINRSGQAANAPESPQICLTDPLCQYLIQSGYTYFKGLRWEEVRHLWIYPLSQAGPNVHLREQFDQPIQTVVMRSSDGSVRCFNQDDYDDERSLLKSLLEAIASLDPDVIAGHQLYDDVLPYLEKRCKRYRLKFTLGRGEATPKTKKVRQKIAEKNLDYYRYDVRGRELIDTWVLAQLYDVTARQMESYELDDVAEELLGEELAERFRALSNRAESETEARFELAQCGAELFAELTQALSQSYFLQAQIFPYTYQTAVIRGNATRINSLFLRAYFQARQSLPARVEAQSYPGGLTAQEYSGLAHEVYHCDVQSLYPSIITQWQITPKGDSLNIFLSMLEHLRAFRLQAKEQARRAGQTEGQDSPSYRHFNALQTVFKVLINSFYGYLGFEQGNFADFTAAAKVTEMGRNILTDMINWLKERGCTIIEVDTDGIYFMTPERLHTEAERQELISALNATLPPAINLEFDGHYRAMYCHKMKNYALLDYEDKLTLKGSALRARNVEPFLRETLIQALSLLLHDRQEEIPALIRQVGETLEDGKMPLNKLAKTDTLISSPAAYAKKQEGGGRNRAAAYELALQAERNFKAGDKVTYYVTGTKATVSVWQNAKMLSSATEYDANIKYYLAKLKELVKKFAFLA